jgi:hypothetical protein
VFDQVGLVSLGSFQKQAGPSGFFIEGVETAFASHERSAFLPIGDRVIGHSFVA